MQSIGIDTEVSAANRASGNRMAEEAIFKFKTIAKNNGLGVSKARIKELVSSLNNCTRLVTGVGSAAECLLGWEPCFNLPMISKQLSEGEKGGYDSQGIGEP